MPPLSFSRPDPTEPTPAPPVTDNVDPGYVDPPANDDPASTRSTFRVSTADRKPLKDALRTAVKTITGALNDHLTRDELEHDAGLYLADDDDQENIADPASALIARRTGANVSSNPDLADAIACAMALATYIGKQLALRRDLRKIRRGAQVIEQPEAAA